MSRCGNSPDDNEDWSQQEIYLREENDLRDHLREANLQAELREKDWAYQARQMTASNAAMTRVEQAKSIPQTKPKISQFSQTFENLVEFMGMVGLLIGMLIAIGGLLFLLWLALSLCVWLLRWW